MWVRVSAERHHRIQRGHEGADLRAADRSLPRACRRLKFTPEGGHINVVVNTADGSLEIEIRDTGIGIPEDRIADPCQPFSRIENVLSSSHQGSGMGLFITKALVERHSGTLVIESGLGEGTTVRVRLPLTPTG